MKRRYVPSILGAALAGLLLFAGIASAAPVLSVEMTRSPETINRGDEFVSYEVKVKNTSPTDPTAGTLNLAIAFPPGLSLKRTEGSGWSCTIATLTCTNTTAVPANGSYPALKLKEIWVDEVAPETVTATATASGAGAGASAIGQNSFTFGPRTPFGLIVTKGVALDEAGNEETQAGGHPYSANAFFRLKLRKGPFFFDNIQNVSSQSVFPVEDLKGGVSKLWPGVVGNPQAVVTCDFADVETGKCPDAAAVGGVVVYFGAGLGEEPDFGEGPGNVVYRLPRERGYPVSFGFKTIGPAFVIRTKVRSDGDYGISAVIPSVPSIPSVYGADFVFCGFGAKSVPSGIGPEFKGCKKRSEPDSNEQAFVTLNTNCAAGHPQTLFGIDSWQNPGALGEDELPDLTDPNWKTLGFQSPVPTGCEQLTEEWTSNHEPSFHFQPDGHAADSPAAYRVRVHIPQEGLVDPNGLATSHMKDVKVTLPERLTFNPAVGHRLESCSLEQIGYLGKGFPAPNPIRFDVHLPDCPEASKIGTVTVTTPLLADVLHGSVFLASQKDNPFDSNYAIYLSIEEPDVGVILKLAGKVSPDPKTGQITTTFTNNPQQPIDNLQLDFFGGDRSALANPVTCGTHEVATELTAWSAVDPDNPQPHEIATPGDQVQITEGANGAPCVSNPADRPFDIGLAAGSRDPIAGAKSPFSIRITRPDGSQEIDRLEISPPPGFVASLKGIPYCSDAQIEAAKSNSGKAEQRNPSCPLASEVGNTHSGAGPGDTPFYAPGKLYLSGPYKGETLSVVAITPAVAGPYDLGNVVIRSALKLDPRTARITAITDPLPQVFEGIPLRIRDVRIELDRPNWAINPTNCEALSVDVTAHGSNGAIAKPSNRYQLSGCERLPFKPKLTLRLKGGTKRGDHPSLLATLKARPGDANIARAAVTLPPSAFLDQAHIRTICTRVQFAARTCPQGAIYGSAIATTPLLNDPIQGDVFLRSSDNKLPDLIGNLRGVANIELVGRIDSVNGGIRTTFDVIPDAAVDTFTLQMQGGKKGLVINSKNLCATENRATVKLTAQNGRQYNYRTVVIPTNCKKAKKGKRGSNSR